MWHQLGTPRGAANAVHLDRELTQLEMARGLLTPLYAARCVRPKGGRALPGSVQTRCRGGVRLRPACAPPAVPPPAPPPAPARRAARPPARDEPVVNEL